MSSDFLTSFLHEFHTPVCFLDSFRKFTDSRGRLHQLVPRALTRAPSWCPDSWCPVKSRFDRGRDPAWLPGVTAFHSHRLYSFYSAYTTQGALRLRFDCHAVNWSAGCRRVGVYGRIASTLSHAARACSRREVARPARHAHTGTDSVTGLQTPVQNERGCPLPRLPHAPAVHRCEPRRGERRHTSLVQGQVPCVI